MSRVIVKNTFLEFETPDADSEGTGSSIRRSASDSELLREESGSKDLQELAELSSGSTVRLHPRETAQSSGVQHLFSSSSQSPSSSSRHSMHQSPDKAANSGTGQSDCSSSSSRQIPWDSLQDEGHTGAVSGAADMDDPQMLFLINGLHMELNESMEVLESLAERGILHLIPRDENGLMTSEGSIAHFQGATVEQCNPCVFWFKGRCGKGISCPYCHFRHIGQKPKRLRESKYTREKKQHEERLQNELSDSKNSDDGAVHISKPTQNQGDDACEGEPRPPRPFKEKKRAPYTAQAPPCPVPGAPARPKIAPAASSGEGQSTTRSKSSRVKL